MDNETKLTSEQINSLLDELKDGKTDAAVNIEEFAKNHLNEKQMKSLKMLLNNPQLIKSILASDKAKQFLKSFMKNKEGENIGE